MHPTHPQLKKITITNIWHSTPISRLDALSKWHEQDISHLFAFMWLKKHLSVLDSWAKMFFFALEIFFRKTINILFWIFFISLQILVKTAFTFFIGESKVKCVQFSCSQLYFVSIAQFGFFPSQNHVNFVIVTQIFKTNLGKLMIEWFFIEVTAK